MRGTSSIRSPPSIFGSAAFLLFFTIVHFDFSYTPSHLKRWGIVRYNIKVRYHVPQFIEIEDKIIGPLTIKQFLYVAGGVGFIALLRAFMPMMWAVIVGSPVLILGLALAFYKINDRPFISVLEAAFFYLLKQRLYLWKKNNVGGTVKKKEGTKASASSAPYVPKVSNNKLKALAWTLDIKDPVQGKNT